VFTNNFSNGNMTYVNNVDLDEFYHLCI
jgi:hypothetical protein